MGKFPVPDKTLFICTGSKCAKRGGKDTYKAAKRFAKYSGQDIEVIRIECTDRCDWAPVCTISPGNIWLKEYSEKDVLKLMTD
ncbi:(2Fe-2S) ferredoxin domain-containing protein [Mucilaginibacter achroorhodeus]|uniref:(2Fe-2S) ferredoxin domain-containing protein n=1 Tax=Mucilaginibacter achroorhodeus TaxID=2599294 RepID=A0A563U8I6_9SPHI|nr:(2Fe-2S) ferredoxin domain-containing protein [Mucilaginibacter achroorhodeus]TWR27692.1 (2Fe-2S) ferredoxin domain-containing protein [Mucilaginibacter achroorhodeus]